MNKKLLKIAKKLVGIYFNDLTIAEKHIVRILIDAGYLKEDHGDFDIVELKK